MSLFLKKIIDFCQHTAQLLEVKVLMYQMSLLVLQRPASVNMFIRRNGGHSLIYYNTW